MQRKLLTITMALAFAGASGITAAMQHEARQAEQPQAATSSAPAAPVEGMDKLQEAAQRLREAVQHMARLEPGPERRTAMRQAREALYDTQHAMLNIAPQLAEADGGMPPEDEAVDRLMEATQRLRESIRALADAEPGKGREHAMNNAEAAILEARSAMVNLPNP